MSDNRGPKEIVYDESVSPLMLQIIEVCRAHGINLFATFSLDEHQGSGPLFCTTAINLDPKDVEGGVLIDRLRQLATGQVVAVKVRAEGSKRNLA